MADLPNRPKYLGYLKRKSHWVSMALLLPLLLPTAALTAAAIIQTMYDAHCNTVCVSFSP